MLCPVDGAHYVSPENIEAHKSKCSLQKMGINADKMVCGPCNYWSG